MTDDETTDWDVGEQLSELQGLASTRRGFLEGTAKLGGGAVALGTVGSVGAQDGQELSDVDILNYALTLERIEYAFYRDGLQEFSENDIANANSVQRLAQGVQFSITDFFEIIRDQEKTHVDALSQTVQDLGGEPVGEAEYNFGYTNANQFVALARTLENTGVAAYAGVAPQIENDELLATALSIHSVEARHAGMLNFANGEVPFPDSFDPARSREEVLGIARQFIEDS